jgi:hypothetical protein
MDFKKNQISTQNPKVLPFSFTEKHHFTAKTNLNSVFLGHEAHILDRLYVIMVCYTSFMDFNIFQILAQNTKVHRLRFYQENSSLWQKLTETLFLC